LSILPLSSDDADRSLGSLTDEQRWGSMHVVHPDHGIASGGMAVMALNRVLPGGRWLASLAARSTAVQDVIDRTYAFTARHRGALARFVPDVAPVERRVTH
jgi:predicted DCC family thiol-disulfide oxidoreductase YuxK